MNEFTELSTVLTHPEYTKNGSTKQLLKFTTDHFFSENRTLYLHVVE